MERIDFRDQIASNKIKSFFLLLVIIAIFLVFAYVIAQIYDPSLTFIIMIIGIVVSILYTWISYYNSDRIAIASVRAREATRAEFPDYFNAVENMALASGLPKPRLYVMDSEQINAFASGRSPKKAVLCFTTGALKKLDRKELEGVVAHEMAHVANYDIRFITLVSVAVGMIAIVSEIFLRSLWFSGGGGGKDKSGAIFLIIGVVLAILAPIVVFFVQMAVSRKREYVADATAVKLTRYPQGLTSALRKIKHEHAPSTNEKHKYPKAVAPMFFANPFKNLASTHPPIDERIKMLERM